MMDFDRLDSILKELGISRRKLAIACGILPGTMSTAFSRRSGLSSEDLLKIAMYLDVSPYALVDLGEKPERNEGSERNKTTITDTIRNLLQRAIDTHGAQIQIFKAVEEMGKLTQALAKLAGSPDAPNPDYNQMVDHVAEEVADVRIMLDQLCMIFDVEDRAVRWRWYKLTRLKERLDQRERLSLQAQPEGQDAGETRGCAKHNGAGRKERLDQMETPHEADEVTSP